jgi:serine/threonine protein phosphatase PrpC
VPIQGPTHPTAAVPARERRASPRLDLAGRTDPGRLRDQNEDQFVIAELGRWRQLVATSIGTRGQEAMSLQGTLVVVASGIGTESGGVASEMALEALLQHSLRKMPWLGLRPGDGDALFRADLEAFVVEVQARLVKLARERRLPRALGTTMTAGYLQDGRLILLHIGDSRAYVMRRGVLTQLTRDHTLEASSTAAERAVTSRVLVNTIGGDTRTPQPDLTVTALEGGDRILLCTDGLYGPVGEDKIAELVRESTSADEAARSLVDEALARGGPDNVTAVVVFG